MVDIDKSVIETTYKILKNICTNIYMCLYMMFVIPLGI